MIEDLQRQLNALTDEMKQTEDGMAEQDMDPFVSGDSVVHFFCGDA